MADSPSVFGESVFNSPRPLPALQAPREAPAEAPAEAPFVGNAAATNAQFLTTLRQHIDAYDVETNVSNHIFFGTMTPELLDCVKSTPPNRAREGGTGIVSKCSLVEGQEFYVKKILGGPFGISGRGVQRTLDKYKNEIEKINNEININIAVSQKIPTYVSICEGAYLSYTIADERISYEAYILFQYLPGLDLGRYLFRYRTADPIPNKDKILTNVSRCLAELHAVGYVHRDIKPENIFLVSDNPDAMPPEQINVSRCILIDFGESLPIGAVLNIPYNNIKGDDRYNPFLHDESIPEFPWPPKSGAQPRENTRAFEFMRNTETGAFGFRRGGGGRKKTNKKQKRRSRTRKHN
jgi:serine/threonine protein kinase